MKQKLIHFLGLKLGYVVWAFSVVVGRLLLPLTLKSRGVGGSTLGVGLGIFANNPTAQISQAATGLGDGPAGMIPQSHHTQHG